MGANQANVALLTQDPQLVPQVVTVLAGGGPTSQRPTNPAAWFHYYDTDLDREVVWTGSIWRVSQSGPVGPQGLQGPPGPAALFGPTAMRPASPVDFQRYYDTDITSEIWWERGAWRTVAGTVGDTKTVKAANIGTALTLNPGWISTSLNNPTSSILTFKSEESPVLLSQVAQFDWTTFDLTPQLASVGLTGAYSAMLSLQATVEGTPFTNNSYESRLYVRTDGGGDPTSNMARAYAASDDSSTRAADTTYAFVQLSGGLTFQARGWWYNWRGYFQICLCGFVYDPTIHPSSITEFALVKT